MHTAEAVTRQIQQANDVTDVVSRYVRLVKSGKELKGLCPFHKEKTPSFYVVPAKQIFKCFGCGAGGDVFKFIQLRENVNFIESRRILAERAGIRLDDRAGVGTQTGPDRAELAKVNAWAQGWFKKQFSAGDAGRAALDYARARGLSDETIEKFGLGFAPDSWTLLLEAAAAQRIPVTTLVAAGLAKSRGEGAGHYAGFRNRLMFPIRDTMDRVVGFGGRALSSDDPAKYLNTPQTPLFDKGRSLYALDQAKDHFTAKGEAIVVEGYLDCLMAHQYGFPHTVATLGTALTDAHVDMLRRYADAVVVVFDSDEAGQRAAERCLPVLLSQRMSVRLAHVPEGKDPCDFLKSSGMEAFENVLKTSLDALEFKWKTLLKADREPSDGPGRMRAIEAFLDLVSRAADAGAIDAIQRGLAVNQIAKLLGLGREEVHQRLRAGSSPRAPSPSNVTDEVTEGFVLPVLKDPMAAATRELLEVVLNEPGYYALACEYFDPGRLPEPLHAVAEAVRSMADELGEFSTTELLSRLEDVTLARCAVALQAAGERRGNFAAAVEGAITRIKREHLRDESAVLRDLVNASGEPSEERDLQTQALGELARQHRHFLPTKGAKKRIASA